MRRRHRPAPRLVLKDPLCHHDAPRLRRFLGRHGMLTDEGRGATGAALRNSEVRSWAKSLALALLEHPHEQWESVRTGYLASVDVGKPCRPSARQRLLLEFTARHQRNELHRNYWRIPALQERVADFIERHPEDPWRPSLMALQVFRDTGRPRLDDLSPGEALLLLRHLPLKGGEKLRIATRIARSSSAEALELGYACNLAPLQPEALLELSDQDQNWLCSRVESLYPRHPLVCLAALRSVAQPASLRLKADSQRPDIRFGPRPGHGLERALWREIERAVERRRFLSSC